MEGYQRYGYAQGGAEATQHFPLPGLAGGFKIVAKAAHAAGQQAGLFFGREAGQRVHCSVHHREAKGRGGQQLLSAEPRLGAGGLKKRCRFLFLVCRET